MTTGTKLLIYATIAAIGLSIGGYNGWRIMDRYRIQSLLNAGIAPRDGKWYIEQAEGPLRRLRDEEVAELGLQPGGGIVYDVESEEYMLAVAYGAPTGRERSRLVPMKRKGQADAFTR